MAAPAARQRTASAAISAGERGTAGFRSGAVTPLIAASMMTGVDMGLPYSPTRRQIDRGPSLRLRTLAAGVISGWQLELAAARGVSSRSPCPKGAPSQISSLLQMPDFTQPY